MILDFFLSFWNSEKGSSKGSEILHGVLTYKRNKILGENKCGDPPSFRVFSDMSAEKCPLVSIKGQADFLEEYIHISIKP